ncbi:hypothetical protein Tco_0711444 [Tanacetum coccineum]
MVGKCERLRDGPYSNRCRHVQSTELHKYGDEREQIRQQRDPNRGKRIADAGRQQQQTDICRQTYVDSAERSEGR